MSLHFNNLKFISTFAKSNNIFLQHSFTMGISLNNVSYSHIDKTVLFENLNLSLSDGDKAAIVGNNGSGKSTLLQIVAGVLQQSFGEVLISQKPYFVPQHLGQWDDMTIAQVLKIDDKLHALKSILQGDTSEKNFAMLNDDWDIEQKAEAALSFWDLKTRGYDTKMSSLSGGEKTKVFLAGIGLYNPNIVLLDEPSNHLDLQTREKLYNLVEKSSATMLIVSHDKTLLNKLNMIFELQKQGIKLYGGNFKFYSEQKELEVNALQQDIQSAEKDLRKAKRIERETIERQNKVEARGKKQKQKEGVARIMMKTLKDSSQNTSARLKDVHHSKIDNITQEMIALRKQSIDKEQMKLNLDNSSLHRNKILVKAKDINFSYNGDKMLWQQPLTLTIVSGERILIKGGNGKGKTTLINILLGRFQPSVGSVECVQASSVYIDQDYSLLNSQLSVFEQAQLFNTSALLEHEIKLRLNRFLFDKTQWEQPCNSLSGGERMRLVLCCLTIRSQAPDIIILDEPTNNLDIQNTEILTSSIASYQGTLIVVSHDVHFLSQIAIEKTINVI